MVWGWAMSLRQASQAASASDNSRKLRLAFLVVAASRPNSATE